MSAGPSSPATDSHRPSLRWCPLAFRSIAIIDENVSAWLHSAKDHNKAFKAVVTLLSLSADGWTWFLVLPVLSLYYGSGATGWADVWDISLGSLLGTVLEFAIKVVARRPRPAVNTKKFWKWNPEKYSFPSGHTLRAGYVAATLVCAGFPGSSDSSSHLGTVVLLLLWVCCVGMARTALGRHFPSDTLFGGLLGLGLAFLAYAFHVVEGIPYARLQDLRPAAGSLSELRLL